jgi:hypothetical protein
MFRTLLTAVIALLLVVGLTAAGEKAKGKGKKKGGVHGKVVSCDGKKLVVEVGKKGAKETKEFAITADTPVTKGKKEAASVGDIKAGDSVVIALDADGKTVKSIRIGGGKKKKKEE